MESTKTSRDVGIDACRIICMLMVVMLHVLDASGALKKEFSGNYVCAWLLEFLSYSAVNCYVLISGYVGFGRKHRMSKIVTSWLQVFCYAFVPLIIFFVVKPSAITGGVILKSLLPVSSESYWFYSVYFALLFAMPLLDHLIETLPQKIIQKFLISYGVLFSICSIISHGEIFGLNYGSGLLWFIYLYLIGCYIKKYDPFSKIHRFVFIIVFAMTVVLQLASRLVIECITNMVFGEPRGGGLLFYYCSFIVLIQAISLLFIFKNYYTDNWRGKIINKLGVLSFGVYLFHANVLIWANFHFFRDTLVIKPRRADVFKRLRRTASLGNVGALEKAGCKISKAAFDRRNIR